MRNKLFFLLLFPVGILFAQSNNTVKTFTKSLKTDYSLANQQITLTEKNDSFNLTIDQRLDFLQVLIQEGDLVIDYELLGFPKIEKGMKMQLNLSVINAQSSHQITALPNQIYGETSIDYSAKNQKKQLIWGNWVENIKPQGNALILNLNATLVGRNPVNCDLPVEWGNPQRWPHYIAGGVGAGLLISSFPVRKKSDNLYIQYIDESFSDEGQAQVTYTKANTKHQLANTLAYTGIGIIAADLLTLGIRYLRFKKKQKDFNYYCNSPAEVISFQPIFERNLTGQNQLNFQLSYAF